MGVVGFLVSSWSNEKQVRGGDISMCRAARVRAWIFIIGSSGEGWNVHVGCCLEARAIC